MGIDSLNELPAPAVLTADSDAPFSSASSLLIERPSPFDLIGSQISCSADSEIPSPVSETIKFVDFSEIATSRIILPPL